jgi:ABC-2 type transport system permease protein
MSLISGMQYRAAAWAGIATQFFFGFFKLMIFRAFYRSSGAEPPMMWEQLAAYLWLQQAFLAMTMLWYIDNELISSITDGHVAYELCRPYDIYSAWYARLIAMRLSSAAMRCLPILFVAFLLPGDFRLMPPADAGALAAFLLSMVLSLLLVVAISMFAYILTFITMSPFGARLLIGSFSEILSGMTIPIPLMPEWMQTLTGFFPFRYTLDLPFRLYSGNIVGTDALFQLGVQAAWIIGLFALGKFAFARVTRRIVIQGG